MHSVCCEYLRTGAVRHPGICFEGDIGGVQHGFEFLHSETAKNKWNQWIGFTVTLQHRYVLITADH